MLFDTHAHSDDERFDGDRETLRALLQDGSDRKEALG